MMVYANKSSGSRVFTKRQQVVIGVILVLSCRAAILALWYKEDVVSNAFGHDETVMLSFKSHGDFDGVRRERRLTATEKDTTSGNQKRDHDLRKGALRLAQSSGGGKATVNHKDYSAENGAESNQVKTLYEANKKLMEKYNTQVAYAVHKVQKDPASSSSSFHSSETKNSPKKKSSPSKPQKRSQKSPQGKPQTKKKLPMPPPTELASKQDRSQWYITRNWANRCVRKMSRNPSVMQGWPQKYDRPDQTYPREYRLGDCVKMCDCAGIGIKPNETSLVQYYYRACQTGLHTFGGNFTILREILEEQDFPKPDPDVLVIHLRLGDVVELSQATIQQMLIEGGKPEHLGIFPKAIKSVPEYLANIRESNSQRVEIIGGAHHLEYYHKSLPYAHCVYWAIKDAGYDVTLRLNYGSPDSEFYYMSYAKKIVVSGGGFSRLIGQMAAFNGGEIAGRFFNITEKG